MLTSGKDGDFLARNWKRNKRIDDILRSSNKNKRICKDRGETTEISISGLLILLYDALVSYKSIGALSAFIESCSFN